MKKIIICSTLLSIEICSFSQQYNSSSSLTKQDYLQKSQHQKTTAWILFGTGTLCGSIGLIKFNPYGTYDDWNNPRSIAFLVTGLAAIGGSAFLFKASAKNKKKAAAISFRMERISVVQQQNLVYHIYPAVSFTLSLK